MKCTITSFCNSFRIITARIRRMREGTVFSLFVSSHPRGGTPARSGWWGRGTWGSPQYRSGWWGDIQVPPPTVQTWPGGGVTPGTPLTIQTWLEYPPHHHLDLARVPPPPWLDGVPPGPGLDGRGYPQYPPPPRARSGWRVSKLQKWPDQKIPSQDVLYDKHAFVIGHICGKYPIFLFRGRILCSFSVIQCHEISFIQVTNADYILRWLPLQRVTHKQPKQQPRLSSNWSHDISIGNL